MGIVVMGSINGGEFIDWRIVYTAARYSIDQGQIQNLLRYRAQNYYRLILSSAKNHTIVSQNKHPSLPPTRQISRLIRLDKDIAYIYFIYFILYYGIREAVRIGYRCS